MWRTQQPRSHVMMATEVEVMLSVREMGTGHLHVYLAVHVSLTYMDYSLTYLINTQTLEKDKQRHTN